MKQSSVNEQVTDEEMTANPPGLDREIMDD